ncbi:MAG: sulfotransferase domain-containing protein [Desulfuromonadales bacterium]|nr:sulfotransferase domain-containing protein [Desulfuromonadales bacterium]
MMELLTTCFESDGFCGHEMSLFEEPDGAPKLFFSKQPSDIKYIHTAFVKDPNLFVLYMVRDPRSVITSVHRSRPDDYFCNFRAWQTCAQAAEPFFDHPRFFKVRYEDLVSEPDNIQKRLMQQFGFLEKTCNFSEYQKVARPSGDSLTAMGGLRAVDESRIAGWRAHLPRLKAELEKCPEITQAVIQNGYELDHKWTDILNDVDAVDFPCRYPDKEFILKTLETRFRKWRASQKYLARREKSAQTGR